MMAEILTAADLERAKQDDTFHAEVITGKLGGNGDDIDFATHARTGQIQMTLPAMIRKYGFGNSGLVFGGGGFLNSPSLLVKYNTDNSLYRYIGTGAFPIAIPAAPDSNWQEFIATTADGIVNANGGSVQDFIDFNDPKWAIVTAYGADSSGVAFSTDAFMAAQAASDFIVVPHGNYNFDPTKKWQIFSGKTWFFMGPTFKKPPATAFAIAYAEFESDFNLIGAATFEGNSTASDIQNNVNNIGEIGLYIESCARYKVGDLSFRNFGGDGLLMSGATGSSPYFGERGRFGFISSSICHYGMRITAGNGSEYNSFTGLDLSANRIGLSLAAGNNTFGAGCITGNRYANIELVGGGNDGHGSMNSVTINHAGVYNLLAQNVNWGFNFNSCHFFGNAPDSASGQIFINNSKGINITGGTLDCWVNVWGGANSGYHKLSNMYCPGSYGKVKIYDEMDLPPRNLLVSGCYGEGSFNPITGDSINKPDSYVSLIKEKNDGQILTLGAYTPLNLGNSLISSYKLSDVRRSWDSSAYIYIVPSGLSGIYKISFRSSFQTTGTIDIKTSRLAVVVNGAVNQTYKAYGKNSSVLDNTDIISIDVNLQILLKEGDTLRFEAKIDGTGIPIWADPDGRMVCEIVRV